MWDVIKDWVFDVIQFFYNGVGDWGMAIIIITIIFRIIVGSACSQVDDCKLRYAEGSAAASGDSDEVC